MSALRKLYMGPGTLEVSPKLFALNRSRLLKELRSRNWQNSIVLLQGGSEVPFYDTDTTYHVFRQESYFMWLFGVAEPDFYGAIKVDNGREMLFIPRLDQSYAIWMGSMVSTEDIKQKYQVDDVFYADEMTEILEALQPSELLVLSGKNSDSGLYTKKPLFKGIEKFTVNSQVLYNVISNLRVIKTEMEIEVMKYVCQVSSDAHKKVMKFVKPGKREYQCESEFLHHCYSVGGCRHVSYTCICGSGHSSSILHYGHARAPNSRLIRDGDMCLFDMGGNYFGYAADITCSFPANGKFTPDQKLVYETVLDANLAVQNAARPGVSWLSMHRLAVKTILNGLQAGGLLAGDVDEMMEEELGYIFQPHGLGHLLGLDVHDVGGYLPDCPPRPQKLAERNLRFARDLEKGMVVTIEPGCYFIDALLDEAYKDPKKNKFLVPGVLKRFKHFGGVRIEDDVLITDDGVLNLTKVPRTVEEIESWMSS